MTPAGSRAALSALATYILGKRAVDAVRIRKGTTMKTSLARLAMAIAIITASAIAQPAFANSGNCGGGYGCPGR